MGEQKENILIRAAMSRYQTRPVPRYARFSSENPLNFDAAVSGQIAPVAHDTASLPYGDVTTGQRRLGFPAAPLQEASAVIAAVLLLYRHSSNHLLDFLPSGSRHEATHFDRQRLKGQSRDVTERCAVAMERRLRHGNFDGESVCLAGLKSVRNRHSPLIVRLSSFESRVVRECGGPRDAPTVLIREVHGCIELYAALAARTVGGDKTDLADQCSYLLLKPA